MAAMVAQPHILEVFGKRTRYFNTFGGNPVSRAAGMAVLEVIERKGWSRTPWMWVHICVTACARWRSVMS